MIIFAFILLNLVMIFSSHLIAYRCCRDTCLAVHLVTVFLFYISHVILSVLLGGAILKTLAPFHLLLLAGIISLTIISVLRRHIKESIGITYKKLADFSLTIFKSKDYFLFLFLVLFFFQVIASLVKIYYLPPHVGDVFSYHLHPVVEWFQQGEILWYTDTPVMRANENPLAAKYIHTWFVIFIKNITWIQLPQFFFGIILSLSCYAVMCRLDLQKTRALRYAVLIYFIPAVLLQSRTCQDHLILAACTLMAALYLMEVVYKEQYRQILPLFFTLSLLLGIKKHSVLVIFVLFFSLLLSRGFNSNRIRTFINTNWSRIAMGLGILLACGSFIFFTNKKLYEGLWLKYSKIFFNKVLVPLLLVILLFFVLRWGWQQFKVMEFCKKRPVIIVFAGGFICLSFFLIFLKNRDFLKPFFLGPRSPVMVTNRSFAAQYPAFDSKIKKNLLAFPFRIKDIGLYTPYTPDLLEKSGFGVQFFAFGLIAYLFLVPLCIFKKAYRNSKMGFLVIFSLILLLMYFFVYFSWANYRSFIFFGVIGIISWAFVLKKMAVQKYFLIYIDVLILLMVLFNGVTCFFEGNMSARKWKTLVTTDNPLDRTSIKYASLIKTSKDRKSWEFIDLYTGQEQHIGYSGGEATWTFPYFDNRMKRRIYFLKNLPGFKMEQQEKNGTKFNVLKFTPDFKASLRQRGIHFIHLNTRGIPHRQRIFMPDYVKDVYKITNKLYYYKW